MDFIERSEINNLIKKYNCEKDSQIILENLCLNGRINRSKMHRAGISDKQINAIISKLKGILEDYA